MHSAVSNLYPVRSVSQQFRQRTGLVFLAVCSLAFISLRGFSQTGHEIRVTIPAFQNAPVILAHYLATENTFIPDDTVKMDKTGSGVFKGSKPLTGGMYIIFLPSRKYFDVLLGDDQNLSVVADTNDLVNGVKFQGSVDNELFYEYRIMLGSKNKAVTNLNEKKKGATSEQQKDSITKAIDGINKEVRETVKKTISEHPGLYLATWLKSMQEVDIPDFPRDSAGKILDSTFQYRYYHKHYFDNFNPADARLLHTPFYENKIKYYFEKIVPPIPDSINLEIDQLIAKVRSNKEIYDYILGFFYKHFADQANQIVGMDGVFVYFAEKYYLPFASVIDPKFTENLKKDLARLKPNLIGATAPEIRLIEVPKDHFLLARTDTAVRSSTQIGSLVELHDIKAKYLVLAFWESDCGHCIKEMPVLYDSVYPLIRDKGAKIVAIQLISGIEGKRKWVDFVNEHKMYDWINAVPDGFGYKDLYNVFSTPSLYVLDENKKIIAKRIGVSQIGKVIEIETLKAQRKK